MTNKHSNGGGHFSKKISTSRKNLYFTIGILGIICFLGIGYSYLNRKLDIVGEVFVPKFVEYKEEILKGTDPILQEPLVPVTIENDGTVKRANLGTPWYKYEDKKWANAVILKDESITYPIGGIIPEDNIESYFVWIPRYKYKLWNVDNTADTGIDTNMVHSIEIVFENKNTTPSNGSNNGEWLTHPAFTSFGVNGMWVGKFETGYDGATSVEEALKNTTEFNKVIIKPDVYRWGNIQVANAFTTSYNYQRSLDSHMMKNTEWGAVAYLSHSRYGQENNSIRINNNNGGKTGYAAVSEPTSSYGGYGTDASLTQPWNTATGYLASTTGNITGVYDMSGGAWEYVMGAQSDSNGLPLSGGNNSSNSGFNGTLSRDDNFTGGIPLPAAKYYDAYPVNSNGNRANRILGDATGEMGPFGNATVTSGIGSWHSDNAVFVNVAYSWFARGGDFYNGFGAGVFNFGSNFGVAHDNGSFRVVLAF